MAGYDRPDLYKYAAESRLYDMDFTALLGTSETLSSITSTTSTPAGLTVGSGVIGGGNKKVQVRCSGGTNGAKYKIRHTCTTSGGNTVVGEGYLTIIT